MRKPISINEYSSLYRKNNVNLHINHAIILIEVIRVEREVYNKTIKSNFILKYLDQNSTF
jgi:hypothetical protein